MKSCEDPAGSPQSWSAGCFVLMDTKSFIHLVFSLSLGFLLFLPLPPLLCFAPCATGSFPFLTGCSRFWRWPRRMRGTTAAPCPTLPGRTSVMKPGSLSPQVRSVAVLYSVWIGSQALLGAARPISKNLTWVLGLDTWNVLDLSSAKKTALSHHASRVTQCLYCVLPDICGICIIWTMIKTGYCKT